MHASPCLLCLLLQLLLHHAGAPDSGIIGGQKAKPHSHPYMASLQIGGAHICGGFLVRKDFILTSAHCGTRCKDITVVLGAHNIRKKEALIQKIPVKECYKHGLYSIAIYDYDIMLIKLQHNAALNKNVKVMKLPEHKEGVPDATRCVMSGWGKATPGGDYQSILQEVSLKIQSNKECKRVWGKNFSPQRMLCTHFNGKRGICQGDSGGPLVCKNKAHGIASFTGVPCDKVYPNVFTKVSFFIPWIKDMMQE